MLAVQVQYWTLQEDIRHNKAVESETYRHNVAQETYWTNSLNETIRHDYAQEDYWQGSLAETTRHNKAEEALGWANVDLGLQNVGLGYANVGARMAETAVRHEANAIAARNLSETIRHNQYEEKIEKYQHNLNVAKAQAQALEWMGDGISNLVSRGMSGLSKIFK